MLTPEDVKEKCRMKEKYRIVKKSSSKSSKGEKPNLGEIYHVSLTKNEDKVVENLAISIRRYYDNDLDVSKFAALGKANTCAQCLKNAINAGVDLMILPPITATLEHTKTSVTN